jgi:hypothetical protein
MPTSDHADRGLGSENGVAALALTAFDGFEEKRGGISSIRSNEPSVGEHRSKLIVEQADAQGQDKCVVRVGLPGGADQLQELLFDRERHEDGPV